MKRTSKLLSVIPALLVLIFSAPATAGDKSDGTGPFIPAPVKGEKCVEDTAVMRRDHMKFLLKHRKEALREGVRTKQYSLQERLACHVPAETAAQPAKAGEGHFCMNCHSYVGVTLDCFECHNTRPESTAQFHPLVTPTSKAMKDARQPAAEVLNKLAAGENNTGAIQ